MSRRCKHHTRARVVKVECVQLARSGGGAKEEEEEASLRVSENRVPNKLLLGALSHTSLHKHAH